MRVLLAVACLAVVFSHHDEYYYHDQAFKLRPGAPRSTFLREVQTELIEYFEQRLMDRDERLFIFSTVLNIVIKDYLCNINDGSFPHDLMDYTCGKEFVKLHNDDPEHCLDQFCDMITRAETSFNNTAGALIAARTLDEFFDIIGRQILRPMMDYNCRCLMKLLDAWMKCKHSIGEADVWGYLLEFGDFNLNAEYLNGQYWKDYWVDVVVNRVPWDDIKILFERIWTNLCQRDTDSDKRGRTRCYEFFLDALSKHYKVYLMATRDRLSFEGGSDVPLHCATSEGNDTVVAKLCAPECRRFYQRTLFSCCTASLTQDVALKQAARNTADRFPKIVYVLIGVRREEVSESYNIANISKYFREFQNVYAMLRDHTCEDTHLSYSMTPCTGNEPSACDGLVGKRLIRCRKKQKRIGQGEVELTELFSWKCAFKCTGICLLCSLPCCGGACLAEPLCIACFGALLETCIDCL